MKKLFSMAMMMLLCAGAVLAQDRVQRVVTIKNGNLTQILHTVSSLLGGTGVVVSSDNERLVLSGPKEAVAGFEELVKQLDVAKKNVETTVYMIVASQQAGTGPAMPAELDPVVKQLKALFTYKGFHLLDSFILRSRDGQDAETSGFVPSPETNQKLTYRFRYQRVGVQGPDADHLVRFDSLRFSLRVPVAAGKDGSISYMDAGISTDVDVPAGKKVVVGKTSAVEGPDSALILVISAKVVD